MEQLTYEGLIEIIGEKGFQFNSIQFCHSFGSNEEAFLLNARTSKKNPVRTYVLIVCTSTFFSTVRSGEGGEE